MGLTRTIRPQRFLGVESYMDVALTKEWGDPASRLVHSFTCELEAMGKVLSVHLSIHAQTSPVYCQGCLEVQGARASQVL